MKTQRQLDIKTMEIALHALRIELYNCMKITDGLEKNIQRINEEMLNDRGKP